MTPYYQDDTVTIYHGDCREILPSLSCADLLLADPPYGLNLHMDFMNTRGRRARRYAPMVGDDVPFDPVHLLGAAPTVVLWGANNFANLLPIGGWLVWDKREQMPSNRLADVELAWCSRRVSARIFRHFWLGAVRASERGYHVHPTQKPVALMRWVMEMFPGDVVDPYMGSGPVLRAAKNMGRKAIGIEIEERYCEIAAKRCAQEVLPLGALGL